VADPPVAPAEGQPEVSVLMCVYNGAQFLDEALGSIRAQTLRDIEILIVDDGSDDDTPLLLARHAAEDPRIRIVTAMHQGPAGARNIGLGEVRGRLVALMDADDVARPDRLAIQAAFMRQNPDVVVLGSSAWHIGPRGRRISVSDAGPATREELAHMRATHEPVFFIAPTVMLDREVVQAAGGFRTHMVPAEDIDLWTRLAEDHTVLSLRERLLQYRIHGRSISTSRFFEQMRYVALIKENAGRRMAGQAELTPAEYETRLQADPSWRRANRSRVAHARYHYRVAGSLVADRDPVGMAHLAVALAFAPEIIVPRLARQLRPVVRRQA
jgi:glycosyltransferase involved in cell wall biosynthesis